MTYNLNNSSTRILGKYCQKPEWIYVGIAVDNYHRIFDVAEQNNNKKHILSNFSANEIRIIQYNPYIV